jgi:hypothetical protein
LKLSIQQTEKEKKATKFLFDAFISSDSNIKQTIPVYYFLGEKEIKINIGIDATQIKSQPTLAVVLF